MSATQMVLLAIATAPAPLVVLSSVDDGASPLRWYAIPLVVGWWTCCLAFVASVT